MLRFWKISYNIFGTIYFKSLDISGTEYIVHMKIFHCMVLNILQIGFLRKSNFISAEIPFPKNKKKFPRNFRGNSVGIPSSVSAGNGNGIPSSVSEESGILAEFPERPN